MHKKSLEASQKMNEEEANESTGDGKTTRDRDEFKTESIASLRAKAQEHNARVLQALNKDSPSDAGYDSTSQGQDTHGGRRSIIDSGLSSRVEGLRSAQ